MLSEGQDGTLAKTYYLVSTDFRVVLNITLNVFPPDDGMIFVRFEEFRDIFRPRFDGIKPFPTEHTGHISLDGRDGGRGEIVLEDPER